MRSLPTIVMTAALGVSSACWADDGDQKIDPPWDNSAIGSDNDLLGFVGSPIFLQERAKDVTVEIKDANGVSVERKMPAFDTRYEARFKVLDAIAGTHDSPTVDFVAYNHYGRPYFHKPDHVLLFLERFEDSWVHAKYLFYPVQRTTDGDWATCGNPYARHKKSNPDAPYEIEALSFIAPFKSISDPEEASECKAGARVADLYAFELQTRFLPNKWHRDCNIELGYSPNILIGSGSHPTMKAQKDAQYYEICIDRKRFKKAK
jgi:hypothetical protein